MSWVREAAAVLAKELRTEWRTRVALSGTALFLLGALTLMTLALRGKEGLARIDGAVAAALLWLLLLFTAATGLGRAFVQETERGTALALRLHARASAVWAGKYAANALLQLALAAAGAPTLLAALEIDRSRGSGGALACVLALGALGIAAVFTTTGALVAQTSARGGLLAALSFPVLVPALAAGVHGTRAALEGGASAWRDAAGDLQALASYTAVAVTASLMLFGYIWEE